MRIAVVTSLRIVNSVYRALPLVELRRRGHEVHLDAEGERTRAGRLPAVDVVHVYRYLEREMRRDVRRLADAGVAIAWDNDDDLLGPAGLRSQQVGRDVTEMLRLADVVTTTTETLAAQYRDAGAREVRVVENYLPAAYAAERPPRGDGILIGWTAAGEHAQDLKRLGLRETLRRLLDAHPDVHVASAGVPLGLPAERYRHKNVVQYQDLARYVGTFDVGIAPIVDSAFNRAKSNVKVKEYAAMGVPWLASPIGPYAGLGEKQGGRLVADDRWYDELERLVTDERARRKLAKRGLKWAAGQRLHRNLDGWEAALTDAAARARGRARPQAAAVS